MPVDNSFPTPPSGLEDLEVYNGNYAMSGHALKITLMLQHLLGSVTDTISMSVCDNTNGRSLSSGDFLWVPYRPKFHTRTVEVGLILYPADEEEAQISVQFGTAGTPLTQDVVGNEDVRNYRTFVFVDEFAGDTSMMKFTADSTYNIKITNNGPDACEILGVVIRPYHNTQLVS